MEKEKRLKQSKSLKSENKKSKKKIFFISFFLVILILIIFLYLFLFSEPKFKEAYISKLSGNVEIDNGKGYIKAQLNQELFLNSKIKTNQGTAVIIIENKIISILEKETEIEISNLEPNNVLLKQSLGRTWYKFKGIIGVDNFEVETPNAVASVRSTEFEVDSKDDLSSVIVAEGKVSFKDENNEEIIVDPYQGAKIINKTIQKFNLSKEDLERIEQKKIEILEVYKDKRLNLIKENKILLNTLKKTYNVDDEKINEFLIKIDNGELDAKEVASKSPIQTPLIEEIIKISEQIKAQQNEIKN